MLPYLSLKHSKKATCFLTATPREVESTVFRNVLVTPLLTCQQFHLQGYEFGINWKNLRYEYSVLEFSISVFKFDSYTDGRIRICVDDLKHIYKCLNKNNYFI